MMRHGWWALLLWGCPDTPPPPRFAADAMVDGGGGMGGDGAGGEAGAGGERDPCLAGWLDANRHPDDGCECELSGEETCDGRDEDCDGRVDEGFDLQTDLLNCGACGVVCARDDATPLCAAGACRVRRCTEGVWPDVAGACTRERGVQRVYVRAGADGDGSAERPFGTLSAALADGRSERQVLIEPGTYPEDVTVGAARVILEAVADGVIIEGTVRMEAEAVALVGVRVRPPVGRPGIELNGCHACLVDTVEVRGIRHHHDGRGSGVDLRASRGAVLVDARVVDVGYPPGIVLSGALEAVHVEEASDTIILGGSIERVAGGIGRMEPGAVGLALVGDVGTRIVDLVIRDVSGRSVGVAHGLQARGSRDLLVVGLTVDGVWFGDEADTAQAALGIELDRMVGETRLEGCRVRRVSAPESAAHATGIRVTTAESLVIGGTHVGATDAADCLAEAGGGIVAHASRADESPPDAYGVFLGTPEARAPGAGVDAARLERVSVRCVHAPRFEGRAAGIAASVGAGEVILGATRVIDLYGADVHAVRSAAETTIVRGLLAVGLDGAGAATALSVAPELEGPIALDLLGATGHGVVSLGEAVGIRVIAPAAGVIRAATLSDIDGPAVQRVGDAELQVTHVNAWGVDGPLS